MGSLQKRAKRNARQLRDAEISEAIRSGYVPMTPAEIVSRLCSGSVTTLRVAKAKALASRRRILWEDVLAQMTPEQRALVEGAQ